MTPNGVLIHISQPAGVPLPVFPLQVSPHLLAVIYYHLTQNTPEAAVYLRRKVHTNLPPQQPGEETQTLHVY